MTRTTISSLAVLTAIALPLQPTIAQQTDESFVSQMPTDAAALQDDEVSITKQLANEISEHCQKMAGRSTGSHLSRRGFVSACEQMVESEVKDALAERRALAEDALAQKADTKKGARIAKRP